MNREADEVMQGASHQIFHVLVMLGQIVFLYGLREVAGLA
jgi:predicted membrane channel-forming protein YqfA (hemolysin III family)